MEQIKMKNGSIITLAVPSEMLPYYGIDRPEFVGWYDGKQLYAWKDVPENEIWSLNTEAWMALMSQSNALKLGLWDRWLNSCSKRCQVCVNWLKRCTKRLQVSLARNSTRM